VSKRPKVQDPRLKDEKILQEVGRTWGKRNGKKRTRRKIVTSMVVNGEGKRWASHEKKPRKVPNCPHCAGPVRKEEKRREDSRKTVNKGNQPPTTM